MLMSRQVRTRISGFMVLVLGVLAGCSTDTPADTAVLNHSAPQSVVTPIDIIAAPGADAGAFTSPIAPAQVKRDAGPFWDNFSSDGGINGTSGDPCNAGFFAVGLLSANCQNQIGAPASFNNQGGFGGGTYWGLATAPTKPAAFLFNGSFSYDVKQLGGWRGGNSEVGWFTVSGGVYTYHPVPQWGDGSGINTVITVNPGTNWGLYIRNNFINNDEGLACGGTHDYDCSDATGDWNTSPRQHFALFLDATGTKFLVAAEDNWLILLPNGAALDSDYNDYFWSVTRSVVAPSLDLTITKSGPANANIGQQVVYTVQGVNNSSVAANNVVVVDTLPLGATFVSASNGGTYSAADRVVTWPTIPTLPANTNTTAYTVTVTYAAAGTYTNNSHINTSSTETNLNNNHADAQTIVPEAPQTDLTITKTGAATAAVGQQVTYTVTGQNLTAVTALNVTIQDTLPAGATFVSASNGGTHVNGVVTWNVGTLAGNSSTIGYTVTVTYAAAGTYKNNSHIFTTTTETNYNNNHADATTVVPPPACAAAAFPQVPGLGGPSRFAVFAINSPGPKQNATLSNVTIFGDVGVASGATLKHMAPSTINGDLFVATGGAWSGPGKITGNVFLNQNLTQDRTDAINASAQAAALAPNFTYASVTTNITVTGVSGLNVVKITGNVNLNNESLTLTGPADAYFVVNIAGSVTMGGTGGIKVGGAMAESHLLVNMTGTGKSLLNTHVGNFIQGTLLGPNVGGTMDGSFGSVILGMDFTLMSGAKVTGVCQ